MNIKPKEYAFVGECPLGHTALVGQPCDQCGMVAEVAMFLHRDHPEGGHEAEGREAPRG